MLKGGTDMATEDFKRKLTAILSADVEGYSRLMAEDEEATVRTITAYRQVVATVVEKHRGRVVDSPGDNILAEFASAVDAVRGGVEIQEELKARNAELPENRRMEFRIGVNLGDVIHEEERIYGDGVNIAARVEGLADGGGICISGTVYEHIKNKLTLGYQYLGEHSVKNIPEPVRVYRVLMDPEAIGKVIGEKRPEPVQQKLIFAVVIALVVVVGGVALWQFSSRSMDIASVEKMAYSLPDKPSIAVLPFDNMSGEAEQEYFSDGLTEQIITNLSKLPNLFVIARNSTFTYKGKPVKVKKVSEELGVRYVLEGSVQKSGDRVRITAQLVDAITGHHLWAERYDRDLGDIFALQDEITKEILTALQVKLTQGESARIYARNTDNLEAYLKFLQAVPLHKSTRKEGNVLARKLAEEAIALDPEFADAYRLLAWTHYFDVGFGWSKSPRESFKLASQLAQKSLDLDGNNPHTIAFLGMIYLWKRQHDKAIAEGERSIALGPNLANNYKLLASTYRFAGRAKDGIPLLEKAIRQDPYPDANYFMQLAMAYNFTGRYDEAIATAKKGLERTPNHFNSLLALTIAYSLADRMEEAQATAEEVLRVQPKLSVAFFEKKLPYKNKVDLQLSIGALRKAGLK
jgi:adenylate cyclase